MRLVGGGGGCSLGMKFEELLSFNKIIDLKTAFFVQSGYFC